MNETNNETIPIIPKNSTNLINILGSNGSPSIINPIVVMIEATVKMFKIFLFII